MKINRFSASAIHLGLSLLVFLSFVAILYFWWFPGDLFFMDGGWQGIKLVAMVDLVLGPLLTLVLFKRGKPSLVFDMSVIASIQIAALAYGFYTTYDQRVVAMVYADHTFNTLTQAEYNDSASRLRAKGVEPLPLAQFGEQLPVNVFTQPFNTASYGEYLQSLFDDFPGIRERSDQYLDIGKHHGALSVLKLSKEDFAEDSQWATVEQLMRETGWEFEEFELYPFKARYESGVAVFDPSSMRIVDILRHESLQKIKLSNDTTATTEKKDPKPNTITMESVLNELED